MINFKAGWQALTGLKEKVEEWLFSEAPPPFNAGAIPDSPADGITVDRLIAILESAKSGDADDLLSLYADIMGRDVDMIAGGLQRKAPLVARKLNATVPPKSDALAVANRDFVRQRLAEIKGVTFGLAHLLDAAYWPVAVVEKIIQPAPRGSGRYYDIVELREVPFWRLTFRADCNGPAGTLKVKRLNKDGTLSGETELPAPARYIVHRGHLTRSLPDCWGGPLRAVVFWWYFGNWARGACARHLENTNLPKWVATAPQANFQAARKELQRAFARAVMTSALIIPEGAKVEAMATLQKDSVEAFISFMALCQKQIAKVVLVQTMTLEGQPQGIGGTQANVQADALSGVQDLDAALLAETLREGLFRPILDFNARTGGVPLPTWGEDDEAAKVKVESITGLFQAGLEPADEALPLLGEIVGFPIRRRVTSPATATGLEGMSAEGSTHDQMHAALEDMAAGAAGDWATAFGADCAGIAQAVREATGPQDLLARVQKVTAGLDPHRSARIMEDVLATAAADGMFCGHLTAGRV